MEIKKSMSGGTYILTVIGIVDSVDTSIQVKNEIQAIANGSKGARVEVVFEDSFVIPSTLIGYLLKFNMTGEANVSIVAKDPDLFDLLVRLNLVSQLNVRKA